MRVILPSGVIIESTDDVESERLAKLVLNGTAAKPTPTTPKKSHHKKPSAEETEKLSKQLGDTWSWLVAHDKPHGVNVNDVADGLNITTHAATFRLNGLIRKGLTRRVRRGYYRPGESHQPVAPPMPPAAPEMPPVAPTASEVASDSPE